MGKTVKDRKVLKEEPEDRRKVLRQREHRKAEKYKNYYPEEDN